MLPIMTLGLQLAPPAASNTGLLSHWHLPDSSHVFKVIVHIGKVIVHVSKVIVHVSKVIVHVSKAIVHVSKVTVHVSKVIVHVSKAIMHAVRQSVRHEGCHPHGMAASEQS